LKTLFLLRHAESQGASGWDNDFDRPLTERGRKDATEIGASLRDQGRIPSLVMHSSARRATETWQRIAPELGVEVPAVADESLYLAAPRQLFATITSTPEPHESLLIVGHNPGLHELALVLARHGASEDLDRLRAGYPAGALSEIRFGAARWSDLRPKTGHLEWIAFPRQVQGSP
jgi:phosphohistidine phosphatase